MDGVNAALSGMVAWVQTQPGVALIVFFGLQALGLAFAVAALMRIVRLTRTQARLLRGTDGVSLERMLLDHADDAAAVRAQLTHLKEQGEQHAEAIARGFRRVGLVRYDAFTDVGGRQSFSLALLDEQRNGIVLSGLHARSEMRVYAKPIQKGRCAIFLTPEEEQAISEASLPNALTTESA